MISNSKFKTIFFRFCKHCEKKHWNVDCDKIDRSKKIFVNTIEKNENDENTILNDENITTYETLQIATIAIEISDSNESKNES